MLRPIETNLSVYNTDHKAHQMKDDQSSHQFQAMRQDETVKESLLQRQTVQKSPESDGEVKIRDRNSDKNRDGSGKRKKRDSAPKEERPEKAAKEPGEHLDFLA
jgi:hypothetical protein